MQFCNVTISQSSIPYEILGEMFKLKIKNYYTHIFTLPTSLKQALLLSDLGIGLWYCVVMSFRRIQKMTYFR